MTVLEMLKEMLAKEIEEHGPESAVAKDLARQIAEPDDGDDHIHVVMIKGDRPETVRRRQLENVAQNDAEAQFELGVMYDTGRGAAEPYRSREMLSQSGRTRLGQGPAQPRTPIRER